MTDDIAAGKAKNGYVKHGLFFTNMKAEEFLSQKQKKKNEQHDPFFPIVSRKNDKRKDTEKQANWKFITTKFENAKK